MVEESLLRSIGQTRTAIINGEVTMIELVNTFLSNAERNSHHNIYVELFDEEAIAQAKEIDNKISKGETLLPLEGAVISIKDNICYKDHTCTAGSFMLENFKSSYHSTACDRLVSLGALIIGRTNCDEFGMGSTNENSHYGPTKNGFDESLVPGGSSGGAAVSVQLACCHVALGSDTGGSVRQPAAFCGIYGFKPTYGRISRWGLVSYASSFDQIGILGNNVSDISLILDHIAGPDEFDSTCLSRPYEKFGQGNTSKDKPKLKVAILESIFSKEYLDEEVLEPSLEFLDKLPSQGIEVHSEAFDYLDYLVPCYYILTTAESSSNLSRYDGIRYGHQSKDTFDDYKDFIKTNRTEGFGLEVKRRIISGTYVLSEGYFDLYFRKAQQVRNLIKEAIDSLLQKYDLILLPTSATLPYKLNALHADPIKMYNSDIFTVLSNLCGNPSMNYPLYTISDKKSIGIQAISGFGDEATLFDFAEYI